MYHLVEMAFAPKLHCWCTYSRFAEAQAELGRKDQELKDKERELNSKDQELKAKDQDLQDKERLLKDADQEREAVTQQ